VSADYVGPDRRRKKGVQYAGGERREEGSNEHAPSDVTVKPQA
jgi:hypothetical protein